MGDSRDVSIAKQFACIFVRNWQYITRSPRALHAVAFQAIIMGGIVALMYNGIGDSFNHFHMVGLVPKYTF